MKNEKELRENPMGKNESAGRQSELSEKLENNLISFSEIGKNGGFRIVTKGDTEHALGFLNGRVTEWMPSKEQVIEQFERPNAETVCNIVAAMVVALINEQNGNKGNQKGN